MAFEVLSRQLRRLAEADDPGYVFRTGSALAFLSASVHVIGDPQAFSCLLYTSSRTIVLGKIPDIDSIHTIPS